MTKFTGQQLGTTCSVRSTYGFGQGPFFEGTNRETPSQFDAHYGLWNVSEGSPVQVTVLVRKPCIRGAYITSRIDRCCYCSNPY